MCALLCLVEILVVDDRSEVRTMLKVALGIEAGLDVVGEAGSAGAAVELAKRLRPQAIVLDLMLPDASPRDAYTAVRRAAPSSRIVVYSARESIRDWFEQQGASFFAKSTDRLDALVAWLRTEAEKSA
ncbi:MAG: hypothetical protein QOC66_816 [Pseudonocardiales bacterium]|jgi:DNA-binding NarL/FixJ family response regulator|nr:hypothetical protein [Pseudonocardiales bacterium]